MKDQPLSEFQREYDAWLKREQVKKANRRRLLAAKMIIEIAFAIYLAAIVAIVFLITAKVPK